MKKVTSQVLETAQRYLSTKKLDMVISTLGEIDYHSISPEEQAHYNLISTEVNIQLGNYNVDVPLEHALSFYKHSPQNDMYAQAKYLYGVLLISRGNFKDVKEILLEAYITFKRCDDLKGQAMVLNRLAFVNYHIGDIEAAIGNLVKCVHIYDSINDFVRRPVISMNLAQLYYAAGQINNSIIQYNRTELAIMEISRKDTCIFYLMSAIPHALKGNTEKALDIIGRAEPYIDEFKRENAIYYENLGWIHYLADDYNRAEATLRQGLALSTEIAPESALVSQIQRRLGDVYVEKGDIDASRQCVEHALSVAKSLNERLEIAACYRINGRMAAAKANDEEACEWFKRAIDEFTKIGARYETAVTRFLAANSGIYHNGERLALLHLAKEYFALEHIASYVNKVEDAASRPPQISRTALPDEDTTPRIITHNHTMRELVDLAGNVADSPLTVLLTGPTGSGKDLLARYVHHQSGRQGKFVSVNTAAIPDSMVESELFGTRKGAFTGADQNRIGLIEEASGGTLYLNEIADASRELQAKLLDALERHTIRRLGETHERHIDFRLIAATNHDLENRVSTGKFRIDLYHRINEFHIPLPSLAERPDDIPHLAKYFLNQVNVTVNGNERGFDRLIQRLSAQEWPGNIRQLKTEIERLAYITRGDLNRMVESIADDGLSDREVLNELLNRTRWNRREVARRLGVAESTIRRRIAKYNLKK